MNHYHKRSPKNKNLSPREEAILDKVTEKYGDDLGKSIQKTPLQKPWEVPENKVDWRRQR
jgi:hypothetical protein